MKQDELDGDPEFTLTIGLGGKSISYSKINKRQFQKWRGICKAYRNPILKFDVRETSFENKGKACGHKLFLPQEVVHWDIWIGGLQRRHNSRRQSPWREM